MEVKRKMIEDYISSNRREYTIQYLIDYDWHRITAIYSQWEDVYNHAGDLLTDGKICRILARDTKHSMQWYTIKLRDCVICLDTPVFGCPE